MLLLFVDRPAFFLPRLKATKECCYVVISLSFHGTRRTGGRLFVWSRTVGDDLLVFRKFFGPLSDFVERDQLRATNVPAIVHVFVSHVDDDYVALLHQRFQIGGRDARNTVVGDLMNGGRRCARRICSAVRVAASIAPGERYCKENDY